MRSWVEPATSGAPTRAGPVQRKGWQPPASVKSTMGSETRDYRSVPRRATVDGLHRLFERLLLPLQNHSGLLHRATP
jgi:hypothetical protein